MKAALSATNCVIYISFAEMNNIKMGLKQKVQDALIPSVIVKMFSCDQWNVLTLYFRLESGNCVSSNSVVLKATVISGSG